MVVRSVANGILEWEREHRMALFIRDDKRATVWSMPFADFSAHHLASTFYSFPSYRVQVVKLDALLIANCLYFVFDVEEATWHRRPRTFCAGHARPAVGSRARLRMEQ